MEEREGSEAKFDEKDGEGRRRTRGTTTLTSKNNNK